MKRLRLKDVRVVHEPPDGWWIDLPFGWVMPGGEHGIVEDTRAGEVSKLSSAEPCECKRCTGQERF